jgi:hypothetical protein
MFIIAIFISFLSSTHTATTNGQPSIMTVQNCNQASVFQNISYEFIPYNTTYESKQLLSTTYHVPYVIKGGSVTLSCNFNGVPVVSQTTPLCEYLSCPVVPGPHSTRRDAETPPVIGTLACTMKLNDNYNNNLMCSYITLSQPITLNS